ncbi:MAG: PEP-CTERM sorting domain-containing protein [Bacillota bacterium]
MWRHWMSVGVVAVGVWCGWVQAGVVVPVERRMDLKATADTEVDDPAEVAVGAEYGVHTAKAEKTAQRTFMMFPVVVSSTITVTSEVRPDLIKLDIHSVNDVTGFEGPYYGQADGWANITFDLTETTKFRVIAGQESRAEGGIGIPMTVWSTPVGGGEPVATDTVDWKLAYLGSSWWATDAIYELGPGRHMLRIGLTDMREAGTCPGGHLWVTMQAVPEPGIAGMLLVGAVGMMGRRRGR